jgi:hypothetical protein
MRSKPLPRRHSLLLCLLSSATLLTACGDQHPKTVSDVVIKTKLVFAEPDPALRECMARLERRPVQSDKDIAQLLSDSFEVGDDCRSKLAATWRSIDDTRARVKAANQAQGFNQ